MRNPFKLFQKSKSSKPKPIKTKIDISLGMERVPLTITKMNRRTIALSISSKDGALEVKTPFVVSDEQAKQFVLDKLDWVIRKRRELTVKLENRIVRRYTDGATHLFLGKPFTLHIIEQHKRIKPTMENGVLTIYAIDEIKAKRQLLLWYAMQADDVFPPIIIPIIKEFFKQYGKTPKGMEHKFVKSYWGVCTSTGTIKLNIELLRAPSQCIEYIMAHELCHLVHANHSPRFYALMTQFMPDWEERKKQLEHTISCKD